MPTSPLHPSRLAPLAALLFGLLHWESAGARNLVEVWNVDSGQTNRLGGQYDLFMAEGSQATVHLDNSEFRGPSGRALKIRYHQVAGGYCGLWMHLFPTTAPGAPLFMDASSHPYLAFWIKGERGGEDFTIQLADPHWLAREDSKPAGRISRYLAGPVTTKWQPVIVPLADFGLPTAQLASLTFNFTVPGSGTVYLDDIHFKRLDLTPVPFSRFSLPPPPRAASPRALWVWETEALLQDLGAQRELLAFCAQYRIAELFFQVVYDPGPEGAQPRCQLLHIPALRAFLKRARQANLRVHALDGSPEFALEAHHGRVFALVEALIEFNRHNPVDQRFVGFHLDNEAYLLPGFSSPLQEDILRQYLELNAGVAAMLQTAPNDMVYGVDIPFWFDELDRDQPFNGRVDFNGSRKDVAKHVIDLVDNVGVMDYRNVATGADGMIAHGQGEIEYAVQAKKKVYLGVETFRDQPLPVSFVARIPLGDWPAFAQRHRALLLRSDFGAFSLHQSRDRRFHYLGLAQPGSRADAFDQALFKLIDALGLPGDAPAPIAPPPESALDGYHTYRPFTATLDGRTLQGFSALAQIPAKTTFAGRSKAYLEEVLAEVDQHFHRYQSYAGIAIHYYQPYKALPD